MSDSNPTAVSTLKRPSQTTVSFATLGCKTNQFESAAMQESLHSAGYQVVSFDTGADLVVINTCTVTNATDAQSRNLIRRARKLNEDCRVIVTGCYAQVDPEALQDLPGVSLVIGNEEKKKLLDFLQIEQGSAIVEVADISAADNVCLPPLTSFSGRSRAFVQIQNGCDAFCSYCIIPYARGRSRSANADEIIKQIQGLVAANYQEVVLTGIHIGNYGVDLEGSMSLNLLVQRIAKETELHRLRLGSIEPTELTDELIDTVARSSIVCPHFHIPLQAGDNDVLSRMKRNYKAEFFSALIEKINNRIPNAAICLDVITGFPGETEQEFANTRQLLADLPVTDLHVFPYSKRPGTPAAAMPDQIPGDVSRQRAEGLRNLARKKHTDYAQAFIGRELEVVVESSTKAKLLKGVSRNYLDLRFEGTADITGHCVSVRAVSWQGDYLLAERV